MKQTKLTRRFFGALVILSVMVVMSLSWVVTYAADDGQANNVDDAAVLNVDEGQVNNVDDGAVLNVDDGQVNNVDDGQANDG